MDNKLLDTKIKLYGSGLVMLPLHSVFKAKPFQKSSCCSTERKLLLKNI